jgi:hypothetical protein
VVAALVAVLGIEMPCISELNAENAWDIRLSTPCTQLRLFPAMSTISQVMNMTMVSMPRMTSMVTTWAGMATMSRKKTASRFSGPGRSLSCTG